MPAFDHDRPDDDRPGDSRPPEKAVSPGKQSNGKRLAVAAESLYVLNLLLFPVIAFLILLYLFLRYRASAPALARNHLEQTVGASLWLGAFFSVLGLLVVVLDSRGVEEVSLWMLVVIVFTIVHATMVLLGVFGLSRAMAGRCYRYPLVGKALPRGCPP